MTLPFGFSKLSDLLPAGQPRRADGADGPGDCKVYFSFAHVLTRRCARVVPLRSPAGRLQSTPRR